MAVLFWVIVLQLAAVVAFVTFVILSLACWYYWSHWKILRVAWKMPTVVPTLPVVGHGYFLLRGGEWFVNSTIKLLKRVLISSSIDKGVFWVGPYPIFMLADPEEIHTVLNSSKSFDKGFGLLFLRPVIGINLFSSSGSLWKMTKRHVHPLFHPRNLDLLYPTLNECGKDLISVLTQHVGCGLVDLQILVNPIIYKSSCKIVFGVDTEINLGSEKFKNMMNASDRSSRLLIERFVRPYAWSDLLFKLLYKNDIEKINDSFNDFIGEVLEASREKSILNKTLKSQAKPLQPEQEDLNSEKSISDVRAPITLDDTFKGLRDSNPSFTDKEMVNEARALLAAGSDAMRVTLSGCLLALAAHPHIQEKLYAEIVSVTGPQDGDVTPEHIRAMPYLDQVLKETMRKFFIVPMISRRVKEDLKLKDWTIPRGSLVSALILGVNFNPRLYPDPERFDPDRFSPENVAARGKYTFIAFSSGPRSCMGKVYVSMVMKTLLIHVLKRFKFSTTVNINCRMMVVGGIAFSLKDGYMVEIDVREKI